MPDVTQLSESLLDLVVRALDHGTESIPHGGPLIPFVMADLDSGERTIERFVGEDLGSAHALARKRIGELSDGAERVAFAYDGYVTIEGERFDAVLVEAQERGKAQSVRFAQRYRPGRRLRKLQPICNAAFLGDGEPLL